MKKYISIEEADVLIEKYYDGTTTGAEEELLQAFLLQEDLPDRFSAERALFGYISTERTKLIPSATTEGETVMPLWTDERIEKAKNPPRPSLFRLNPVLRWSFAAAVLLFGVFILGNHLQAQNQNVAYVDGVRCTDSQKIKALAIVSIQDVDLSADEVAGTVDHMNDNNLIENQLQEFPEIK